MAAPDVELFVPGRICLFGEHSDWAGEYRRHHPHIPIGACIVSGTNQGLRARARAHPNMLVVRSTSHTGERRGPWSVPMEASALLAVAQGGTFWSYAAGVAHAVLDRFDVGGLELDNFETSLPAEKGLSSSAALCVLLARAFSEVYGLRLSVRGEMELAYLGETTTPSQCGRMDQCCAFGVQPVRPRARPDPSPPLTPTLAMTLALTLRVWSAVGGSPRPP
jgi:galactokinase